MLSSLVVDSYGYTTGCRRNCGTDKPGERTSENLRGEADDERKRHDEGRPLGTFFRHRIYLSVLWQRVRNF